MQVVTVVVFRFCPRRRHPRDPGSRLPAYILLMCSLLLAGAIEPRACRAQAGTAERANRLAGEASPYLQLHVRNPVDWVPWGDEAFSRARAEDKPVFLSIGYSSCYWCHVMEREVFSNPAIAELMNRWFINIKVDREERPDVDEIYMWATQLLTGSGGWPNSVFLTPEGKPFFAGTYFPPEDTRSRTGFPTVLRSVAERWRTQRPELLEQAERVTRAIAEKSAATSPPPASLDSDQVLRKAVDELARRYDPTHGGFSQTVKFPSPPSLNLLLAAYERGVGDESLDMLQHTLDEMALGGIYDHLGGGFHRYSTEPTWSVPHFEKMLYDNAQLLGVYARAYAATGRSLYRRVAQEIASYLDREMTHPQGGLYSAQDAETETQEGASYLWQSREIERVLGAKTAAEWFSVYELTPVHRGPPSGPGALRARLPPAPVLERHGPAGETELFDRLATARARLLTRRNERKQPLRDEKVLAAWNGLAIRGLADAARLLQRPDYLGRAERAAHFVLSRHRGPDGRLYRSFVAGQRRERAVLDDYAFLADGMLALYSATAERYWLDQARALGDSMLKSYEGPEGTGFYLTPEAPDLIVRPRSLRDGVLPSGNGVALGVLRELASRTGDRRYARATERTLFALGGSMTSTPSALGTALVAISRTYSKAPIPLAREKAGALSADRSGKLPALPTGRDYVRVALRTSNAASERVAIQLQIDEGWHVNANPASLAFLIPTSVELLKAGPDRRIHVEYPPGTLFHPRFSVEKVAVYEGKVELPVKLPDDLPGAAALAVTFQACDVTSCLPPETLNLELP
jgi:uncharacterized protein YyaL (SSP411 family)